MKITRFVLLLCVNLAIILTTVYSVYAGDDKIAFSSNRKGNWDIYVMNPDGSKQVRITDNRGNDFSPVWSPTRAQILFVSDRDGTTDLYVMEADGRRLRKVFRSLAKRIEPAWAPDGERIVFHGQSPAWSIQTATIHGTDIKQIAGADRRGGNPSWSPDGNEIAFVDNIKDSRRIRIVTLSSGDIRTFLPKQSSWMYSPAWSPEGERLAFSWYKWGVGNNKQALFVANRNGGRLKQIGKSASGTFSPAWSPEGDKIVYTEEVVDRDRQIVVMDVRSGKKKEITRRGLNITPSWFNPINLPVVPQSRLLTTLWGKIKAD